MIYNGKQTLHSSGTARYNLSDLLKLNFQPDYHFFQMLPHFINFFAIQGRIFRVLVASCVLFTLCFDEYRQSLYNAADCRIWRHSLIDAKFNIFSINEKKSETI